MKKFLKLSGTALLALVLLLGTILIAGAWYMRRPGVIENIRHHTSQTLGGAVTFGDLDLKVFKGFAIEKLSIYPEAEAVPGEAFLEVRNIDLRYIPWKFLRSTIEFKNVILEEPHLFLRQARDGSWRVPKLNLGQLTEKLTFETGILRFIILMDDFDLRNGRMTFLNDARKEIFQAEGVHLKGSLALEPGSAAADGQLRVRRMLLARTLQVDAFNTPLNMSQQRISLTDLGADIHGGRLGGKIQVDLAAREPAFLSVLNLTGVQLASILREFKAREGLLEGQLDLKARIEGTLREPALLQGSGEFEIRSARLTGLGVSGTIAEVLRIPELATQSFPKVSGTFKIAEEQITFYNLEAVSPRMQATATGKIGIRRELDFDIQLALSPEMLTELPGEIRKRLNLRPDGYGTVTFKVEGTIDQPRSNLAEKITGKP